MGNGNPLFVPSFRGNQRVGVFASRATHRPNPLGLSKVELRQVECIHGRVFLHLGSVDLVDGSHSLRGEPYARRLDEREGHDRPVDTLASHDGGIDLDE